MDIPALELRQKLAAKFGFVESSGKGRGDHVKFRLYVDGLWIAQTQIPHGRDPVRQKLAGLIARQLGVTSTELREMVNCTIDRDQYLELVRRNRV